MTEALTGPPQPLTHRLRVRYAECDQQGVVFNAHYLAWCDVNLTELWRAAFGSYEAVVERGVDVVVAAAQLRFRAPARFDEEVELSVSVAHLGTTSVITDHTVSRAGGLLVEARLRHVTVDPRTMAKRPIPDWMRAGLAPWTLPEPVPAEPLTRPAVASRTAARGPRPATRR
jgi:acyl-CoA thioester hydrolase